MDDKLRKVFDALDDRTIKRLEAMALQFGSSVAELLACVIDNAPAIAAEMDFALATSAFLPAAVPTLPDVAKMTGQVRQIKKPEKNL